VKSETRADLTAGDVGKETEPRIGAHLGVHFTLDAVHRDQSDRVRIKPDCLGEIADGGRFLNLQVPPPRLIGKELTKYFDIDCHGCS